MRVVVTSDFHGYLPEDVSPCDLLLVGGDVLGSGGREVDELGEWLARQPAEAIVGIAGNHDFVARHKPSIPRSLPWRFLENEACVVGGVKIFGSPMSMPFGGWEYMAPEHELEEVWKRIPADVEILMVHGPAAGILDKTRGGTLTGSRTLRDQLVRFRDLKLLVTGHIHEAYGQTTVLLPPKRGASARWLRCVNGSHLNEMFRPGNPPIEILL